MCKSQAEGGQRCSAHTHVGVAATHYAKAISDLDDAQVSSIFHRLRSTHKDAPAPTAEDATATLVRLRREVLDDPRLTSEQARRIADRYSHALEAIQHGEIPDGRTWAAMSDTPMEAQLAQMNLNNALKAAARQQRTSEDRLAATFRKWRRDDDFEQVEAPDPAYRLDPAQFPADKHTQRALTKLGFENYLSQRMPVFVYGTLRNGQGNDRLMDGAIAARSETAQVEGIAIYGANRGFPYAQEAPDGQGITRGDLVHLSEDQNGDWSRNSLDNLEGFDSDRFSDSHYRRVAADVTYTDPETGEQRTTKAWTYLAGSWARESLHEDDRIHDGDWVAAKTAYRAQAARPSRYYYDDLAGDDEDTSTRSTSTDTKMIVTDDDDMWAGDYVVKKSAVENRSAQDSASAFAAAGLIDLD